MNKLSKTLLEILPILVIFIVVSYFIQVNLDFFTNLIQGYEILGAIAYIILAILVTIFAPLTAIPIIPLVSALYGWPLAGLFSFVGWFIGSLIIFYLCRKWGNPLVKKLVSLEKVQKLEKSVSSENKFWAIFLLRMAIPADVLSYALGLFTNVPFKVYFWASFLGMIPFAFIIAYLGGLSFIYQLIGALIIGVIFLVAVMVEVLKNRKL